MLARHRMTDRDRQLAKARIEKVLMEQEAESKRMEMETKGRKLLKDIEFLHRKAEIRLQEERLTEEVKHKLNELTLTRRRKCNNAQAFSTATRFVADCPDRVLVFSGIEGLRSGSIKVQTLIAIEEVHLQMCRELFNTME